MLRPWLILILAVILAMIAVAARLASWVFAALAVLLVTLAVVGYVWRRTRRHREP